MSEIIQALTGERRPVMGVRIPVGETGRTITVVMDKIDLKYALPIFMMNGVCVKGVLVVQPLRKE